MKQCVSVFVGMWLVLCGCLTAQQDPLYSQYQFNTLVVNPAYAGSRGVLSAMLLMRRQWVGFEGAPATRAFTLHTPFTRSNVSLGLSLVHDELKPLSQSAFFADYAYALRLGDDLRLSLGIKGGISRVVTDWASLHAMPGSADPAYPFASEGRWLPNVGLGFYLYHPRFFFGVSVPKLMENDLSSQQLNQAILSGHEVRHYFVAGGWAKTLNAVWSLKPSLMARVAQAAPWSVDANLNLLYRDRLWLGGMYRFGAAYGGMVKLLLSDRWSVGYAIEYSVNDLRRYAGGTHEVMLGYEPVFKHRKVSNPRFF